MASVRWTGVCLDCADAEGLAAFYRTLFGWEITARDDTGWMQLRDPSGGVGLNIQAEQWYRPPVWPERDSEPTKMLHFEIEVDDLDGAVADVLAAGGREAPHQPNDRAPDRLRVMLDPAGHPFCLYVADG